MNDLCRTLGFIYYTNWTFHSISMEYANSNGEFDGIMWHYENMNYENLKYGNGIKHE